MLHFRRRKKIGKTSKSVKILGPVLSGKFSFGFYFYLLLNFRLSSKGSSKKVTVKLNRRKDIHRILSNRKKLKNLKPESVQLPGKIKVFINESLCLYCKKLWSKCKSLWSAGHISVFWVRNGSLRIKLSNGSVSIITHDCDLEKLFPDNSLIEDN